MINPTVNPELVEQITALVQAWTEADRRIREMFHGWEQRSARAGVDRGFCLQLAQLPGASAVIGDEIDDMETAGRLLYRAYTGGAVTAAMDDAQA